MAKTDIIKVEAKPVINLFEEAREKIYEIVPHTANAAYLIRTTLATVSGNSDLLKCSPQSILLACMEAFRYGLMIGGARPQAYVLPFKGEAKMIISYKGLIDLCGPGLAFNADVVYEADEFDPPAEVIDDKGSYTTMLHKRAVANRGKRIGCWARARHTDGRVWVTYMDESELMRIKDRSPSGRSGNFSPWATDTDEMCKKTAIRRLSKVMPFELVKTLPPDNDFDPDAPGGPAPAGDDRPLLQPQELPPSQPAMPSEPGPLAAPPEPVKPFPNEVRPNPIPPVSPPLIPVDKSGLYATPAAQSPAPAQPSAPADTTPPAATQSPPDQTAPSGAAKLEAGDGSAHEKLIALAMEKWKAPREAVIERFNRYTSKIFGIEFGKVAERTLVNMDAGVSNGAIMLH